MKLRLFILLAVLILNNHVVSADVGDFAINDFMNTYSGNKQSTNSAAQKSPAQSVDFTPYMKDLNARIKQNFVPPRGSNAKKIVVLFSVKKDGTLLSAKILASSNDEQADIAALRAIANTKMYPLPKEFNGEKIDIQFTFDYSMFRNRQPAYTPNPNAPWYNPSDSPKYTGAFDRNAYEQWYKEHKRLRNSK